MENLQQVENVLDKACALLQGHKQDVDNLGDLIAFLSNLKQSIDERCAKDENYELDEVEVNRMLNATGMTIQAVESAANAHRDSHQAISKVGKAINQNFNTDLEAITQDLVLPSNENRRINQAIAEHMYRNEMPEIAETLAAESGIPVDERFKEPICKQTKILQTLKEHNWREAVDWCVAHRAELGSRGHDLEFKLHRLGFLSLIQRGSRFRNDALRYAQQYFQRFKVYEKDIQVLMGTLLYLDKDLTKTPYAHLFHESHWIEACDIFKRLSCRILGIQTDSALSVAFSAGVSALNTRAGIAEILNARKSSTYWNGIRGLPVETDLGKDFQYHSVFACPILREQTSEDNPPMRLTCGHVISRDAFLKLCVSRISRRGSAWAALALAAGSGSTRPSRIKCPYCPAFQDASKAREIKF